MKRDYLILVVLVLLSAPTVVCAQFFYTLNPGINDNETNVTITGYYGPDGDVTIPSTIEGLPVVSIGENAFLQEIGVTNVTIPTSVASIGASAFSQAGLTSITVPGNVMNVGPEAFAACSSLTNAFIANGVISIGASAFSDCSSLADLTIPSSVIAIEPYAFAGCRSLTNASLLNGLLSIGDGAFNDTRLTTLAIPGTVASIGEEAFYGCSDLTNAFIPANVISIGARAFSDCGLTEITVDSQNPNYSSVDGILYDRNQTTLIQYPGNLKGSYTTLGSVTRIADSAFAYCEGVTNVIITGNVNDIETNAFYYCNGLISVTIPGTVNNIQESAFGFCFHLTNVSMANGVGSIGVNAFDTCAHLKSITIPASVTNIGAYALAGMAPLSVYFLGNAPDADSTALSGAFPGTVYYLPGTTGWSSTYEGVPTALWTLPYPMILSGTPNFGAQNNGFSFNISWATNRPVVVEASTDLANPIWQPLQTNSLVNGTFTFTDPQWTNYPGRFYRVSAQ